MDKITLGWRIWETEMSKLSLIPQEGSLIYNFRLERKNWNIDRMKNDTSERCSTYTLYHSVKVIIPKVTNNM